MAQEVGLPSRGDAFARYGGRAAVELEEPLAKYGGFAVTKPEEPHTIQFHEAFAPLFRPSRYKILEGGRGSMKSWACARALIIRSLQSKIRILCAREYQTTIADSVHKLLTDQIEQMGLSPWFKTTKEKIKSANGSQFIFVGLGDLSLNIYRTRIKSFEAVDICWVEEAEGITERTWEILIPTIRKAGSEIWIVYNPNVADDATYQRFNVNYDRSLDSKGNPVCVRIVTNWRQNLWMSEALLIEKNHLFANDPEAAAHVWDGELRKHAEAAVFRHKYVADTFVRPPTVRPMFGADWGYSQDPTVLVQLYITGEGQDAELWIENEAWGIEIDFATNDPTKLPLAQDLTNTQSRPGLFEKLPEARKHVIKADSAQPGIISYVRNMCGYNIVGAEKWPGSVEDGVAFLRGFKLIHVHQTNCPHAAEEFRLYSWLVDRVSGEITNVLSDKNNHCIDAIRYACGDLIRRSGSTGVWARLGRQSLVRI